MDARHRYVGGITKPGVNTPQFDHGRSKMSRAPMPVPPIYEPEVAADAVHYAAHAKRRQVWVGGSTVEAIVGNELVPGLGDVYLARTGVDAQLTHEPAVPRDGNLFDSVDDDPGAHGRFGDQAKARSVQLWLSKRRR